MSSETAAAIDRLRRGMYADGDVHLLPMTLDTDVVAGAAGVSTWSVYQQTKAGTFPIRPLTIGTRYRWPTRSVLAMLGVLPPAGEQGAANA